VISSAANFGALAEDVPKDERPELVPRLGVWGNTMGLDNSRAGVRVTRIDAGSPVLNLRLLPIIFDGPRQYLGTYRDVIVAVDGQRVTKVDELNAALFRAGEECRLTIYDRSTRREERYYVQLP
jgi:S1-C subfamily serine protease